MRIEQNLKFDSKVMDAMIELAMSAKRVKFIRILLFGLGAAYIAYGLYALIKHVVTPTFFVLGICMLFFALFYVPIVIRSNVRKMNAQTSGKKVQYICDENGVDVHSEYGGSHYEWAAVQAVHELSEYVVLRLVNQNSLLFERKGLTEEQIAWMKEKAASK